MEIKNEMQVTVYTFPHTMFLPNVFGNFETLLEDYPLVAYSEDMEVLFQSEEAYKYSKSSYIKDIMHCISNEMTYAQYVQKYKDILNIKHADAPVLNDLYADQHMSNVPEEFRPINPFERLSKLGLNFKIG